jgi:translation initiation factor 2B subunit (eIF-2B alpha/beta/delta family)
VYDSIDNFVFDDLIFHEDDRRLIEMLKNEEYENFTCEEIAIIIPKLIKTTDFEDGHFTHLRNYLISEKEKVQGQLNAMLLNLPEFRWKNEE